MSAFYVQHQPPTTQATTPKIRQEGFQIPNSSPSLNAPPSPSTPFDPQNAFFHPNHVFPNAFKKFNDSNSMDFSDTLASMMAGDSVDDRSRQVGHHHNHHTGTNGVDYAPSQPQSQAQQQHLFDISAFPSHLNNFRGTPDSGIGADSPVQHNFFGDPPLNHGTNDFRHHSYTGSAHPPILPRLNTMRTSSPSTTSLASPSELHYPSSPFSPNVANNSGSTIVHSQSRSRSRSRTAASSVRPPPTASRSRVGKKRTTSISSPSPPGSSSGLGGTNGMAIVIPDIHSPPPHSPATSWMFSPSSQQTAFSLPDPSGGAFNNGFGGPQSVPMGGLVTDDKPSVLGGKEDAASKQSVSIHPSS